MYFKLKFASLHRILTEYTMTKIYKNWDIPKFILDKRYLVGSVFFILTFSILFMIVYSPFSMTSWFSVTDMQHFGMTVSFYVVALAILLISKIGMFALQNRIRFTYPRYILWIIVEVIIISIFYTHFTFVFVSPVNESVGYILFRAFGCVTLIIAIPYIILTLFAAYKTKTEELEMLQYKMSLSEENSVAYPSLINLYDYNGVLKLTIHSDSLYYMESQDNYIKVHYRYQDKMHSYMLRCRTKTLEENLTETSMVRCHRSYMVNVMQINHIKKSAQGRFVVLNDTNIEPIPVSRSYFKNLIEKIDKYNNHPAIAASAEEKNPVIAPEEVKE